MSTDLVRRLAAMAAQASCNERKTMTITDAPTPEPGVMTELTARAVSEVHHLSLTVTDLDASLDWYSRVFGTSALPVKFMHHDCEDPGYGMLLPVPGSTVWI